jgi:hypothetical protein
MTTISEVPTATPASPRTEAARQALTKIREIIEGLEGLTFLTTAERVRSAAATVPDRFLEAVASTMEGSPVLAATTKLTPAQFREMIAYSQAALALADELERLTRGVRDTVKVSRAEVGTEALRLLGIAQKMNRPLDRTELVSSVEQMQRALGRGRKKATPTTPPEPTPAPTAPSTPTP